MISPSDGTGLMVFTDQSSFWDHFKFLSANPYFNLNNVLLGLYLSGLVRYLIVFFRNNAKIIRLIQQSEHQNIDKYKLTFYKGKTTAFSWFRYIFVNQKFLKLKPNEQAQIIEHEKIHARQLHSLDVLIYEILEIFFWFNPLVTKSKQTLKNIHEFIVDNEILNHTNAEEYSNLLIKLSVANPDLSAVNNFSKSPLFDRIWLMAFPTPEKLKKIRFASGIPLMIAVLISYSFIISEINRSTERLQIFKKSGFEMPVKGDYQIVSLFFEKKPLNEKESSEAEGYQILISHPEVSFSTESFSSVYATQNGTVKKIAKKDNWGIEEIEIEIEHSQQFTSKYKGLEKSLVVKGDIVKQGQEIARTGDNRLYPTISFQLLKKGRSVDPFNYIKK
jgi:murein DD-endopeptidase MepM/ murein hydrolase activator NlpD